VDQTLREGTGICFDYASLFACMLRVQGIPTQLVVGELLASKQPVRHAWNNVWISDAWLLIDPTHERARYDQTQYVQLNVN
jgi:transglutaminase-like putative cysteine protease